MEEARIDFLKQIGWGYEEIESMGIISPVTSVECKYKSTTTFADDVYIDVWIEEFKGVKLKICYNMQKSNGTSVCEAVSEHCFINKEGKIISLKREYPQIFNDIVQHLKTE
jgi:acyl-CoA thioester hydrolase